MINTIKTFFQRHGIDPGARFIIAVSGGPDSIALLHAFKYMNADILALHCNFALRGKESDMDEQFVKRFCDTLGIPRVVKHFDTRAVARSRGISIEMAARELRRDWFEETRAGKNRDYIVLGHHAGDQAETLLLNLCRGTGIRGLAGMHPVNGRVLRPFLERSREEIIAYIEANRVGYRVDSSNASLDYTRNKIRHRVIPLLEEINPAFSRVTRETCRVMNEALTVYRHGIECLKRQVTTSERGELLIHVRDLAASPAPATLLFEILRPYGFNAARVKDILDSSTAIPGKQFRAGDYLLSRERVYWRLSRITREASPPAFIDGEGEHRAGQFILHLRERAVDEAFTIPPGNDTACLDLDKLTYPLLARHWQEGDRFCPLGMNLDKKKLSDFFVDRKFNARQKRECLLLLSGDEIAWVVGYRLDDRYKITSKTRRTLVITATPVPDDASENPPA
ncbi:MAG: tRNA lysidine(34) synthetase TilS [Odoribacteraceae bacterium]|jgi:tRNA(Ile)-lysidine synthase|nr:tRNA lysidine(34) synthetase TilS [Odoribacteraceae bacterium]